ncbi:LuxR C-terminal-related transcriptional regulator [Promicromonospora sp. NPDC050262]|uniref:LuxR C-terminal-related transcriptional regulator n=1 Tax=Promicromonospora sp. NPDC050262 TaxID=3155036 RepID=UPI0033EA4939
MPISSDEPHSLSDDLVHSGLISGDLDRIEALFDARWYDLASRFSPEVLRTLEEIPTKVFESRPRLLHAALLAYLRAGYAEGDHHRLRRTLQFYVVVGQRYGMRLGSFSRSGDLLAAGAAAVISGRMRGDYSGSERIGAWTDAHVTLGAAQPVPPWKPAAAAARPGWLSAERGLTAMLGGSLDEATRLFTRAHAEAGQPPYAHYAGTSAAANLALLSAWRGHFDLARNWLEAFERSGSLPGWIEHQCGIGAATARALIAIDEGDPDTAAYILRQIGPATESVELWPFIAFAKASYEAHFGDPHRGLRALDAARQRHAALSPDPTTMAGELILRAEAKLLLRVGAGTRVLHLSDQHAEIGSLILYAAWAHLLAGDHHEAMRLAAEANQCDELPLNDQMGLRLVEATTHLRTGHLERAGVAFLSAMRLRASRAHVSPFLALHDVELEELARLARVVNPLHGGTVTARYNAPPSNPLVHLTPREHEVLRALSTGQTAKKTAAQFGVSVTTVRTQIRRIYQKLRVSHRKEALAKAESLGLLRAARLASRDRAG